MPTDAPDGNINAHVVRSRVEEVPATDGDLSTLLKADLVQLATEAGIDATGMTKAEIVDALQGASDGNVNEDP